MDACVFTAGVCNLHVHQGLVLNVEVSLINSGVQKRVIEGFHCFRACLRRCPLLRAHGLLHHPQLSVSIPNYYAVFRLTLKVCTRWSLRASVRGLARL